MTQTRLLLTSCNPPPAHSRGRQPAREFTGNTKLALPSLIPILQTTFQSPPGRQSANSTPFIADKTTIQGIKGILGSEQSA